MAPGLAVVALAGTLIAIGLAGHWALYRRRLAGWDAEWRPPGPGGAPVAGPPLTVTEVLACW